MEQYAYKDLTFEIFKEILMEDEFRDFPDVGIVVQAYLPEAERDTDALLGMGRPPRHADLGAAGEGGLLGLRDGHGPGARLAHPGLSAEMGIRRQLRAADAVPHGEPPLAAARPGQPQPPQPFARHRLRQASRRARRTRTSCRCSTAWGAIRPSSWPIEAIACEFIRRSAN